MATTPSKSFRLTGTMSGGKEMEKTLQNIAKQHPVDVKRSMEKHCAPILAAMKAETPVDSGKLRDSEQLEVVLEVAGEAKTDLQPSDGQKIKKVTATFSTNVEYAVYVHENLDAQHPTGGPKFMERPLKAMGPAVIEQVGHDVQLHNYRASVVKAPATPNLPNPT